MTISRWIILRMRNVSNKSCRENQNTFCIQRLFNRITCRLWGMVEKYGGARENAHNMAYWISKRTRSQTHARLHANTHARTHAQTHTHMLTNARTHAEKYVILIAFPQQQWLRERVSVMRYTYIACLVTLINVHFILTVYICVLHAYCNKHHTALTDWCL